MKITQVLHETLKEIEKDNPFELIGKGGTILAIYYLQHRDSQDLDFDCEIKHKNSNFKQYFTKIFESLNKQYPELKYKISKEDHSQKGRYHMSIIFTTHKILLDQSDKLLH